MHSRMLLCGSHAIHFLALIPFNAADPPHWCRSVPLVSTLTQALFTIFCAFCASLRLALIIVDQIVGQSRVDSRR
ncbi:hypothetical protein C8R43DRAFT_988628 [Mycena crocata]|nr:hypothetical protein C8R43DRAFT_988628 [Mycena crocata]